MAQSSVAAEQVLNWLLDWFQKRGGRFDHNEHPQILAANYFELGLIDSMGLMELIAGLEGSFSVHFNEDHFQDIRFTSLKGLADITSELARRAHPSA